MNLIRFLRKRLTRNKIKSFEHLKEVIIKNCDDEIIECGKFDKDVLSRLKNKVFKNKELELITIWYNDNVFEIFWQDVDWVCANNEEDWNKRFDNNVKSAINRFEALEQTYYFIFKSKTGKIWCQIVGLYNKGYDRTDFIINNIGKQGDL